MAIVLALLLGLCFGFIVGIVALSRAIRRDLRTGYITAEGRAYRCSAVDDKSNEDPERAVSFRV